MLATDDQVVAADTRPRDPPRRSRQKIAMRKSDMTRGITSDISSDQTARPLAKSLW